jgi:hypothetical protein
MRFSQLSYASKTKWTSLLVLLALPTLLGANQQQNKSQNPPPSKPSRSTADQPCKPTPGHPCPEQNKSNNQPQNRPPVQPQGGPTNRPQSGSGVQQPNRVVNPVQNRVSQPSNRLATRQPNKPNPGQNKPNSVTNKPNPGPKPNPAPNKPKPLPIKRPQPPVTTHKVKPPETVHLQNGAAGTVTRTADGRVASMKFTRKDGSTIAISHPLRGGRGAVAIQRKDGSAVVARSANVGYVQSKPFIIGGRTYVQRTYVFGGRSYAVTYRSYDYRGVTYYSYAPAYYYGPAYYGWAYNSWPGSVRYSWGWSGAPWCVDYGCAPAPFYPSPSYWLADYLIAANLQAAYQAQFGGAPAIDAISAIAAQPNQTITIAGSGFGLAPPFLGDSAYIQVSDLTQGWNAGYAPQGDAVNLAVQSWTNSHIVIGGFTGAYGQGNWVLNDGDQVVVRVWNAQTGAGPTNYALTVGQPPTAQPAPASPGDQVQLSDAVRQQIADEVRAQIEAEKAAAAGDPPATAVPDALNPAEPTFVVANNLDVSANGEGCSLTPGDVLTRIGTNPDANQNLQALVTGSKGADCAIGSQVSVSVQDLQDMHNQLRQQTDAGLREMSQDSGRNGMPAAPNASTVSSGAPEATPDPTAANQLAGALKDADLTEKAVEQTGSGS